MNSMFWLAPPAAAAVLAFCLSPLVSRLAVLVGAIDMPGERKIHHWPIPRLGARGRRRGGDRLARELVVERRAPADSVRAGDGVGFGILPVILVSLIDDIRSMKAAPKFLAHILGASFAVWCGVSLQSEVHLLGSTIHVGLLAAPLSVLWIVGVTNAFNIIDGLDGLSAGLALIAAASMAAVFVLVGQPAMAGAALALTGALIGFLPYNMHPARMFLGDTGATAIGFCLACFALKGGSTLSTGFAALMPVFVMGLPIADTLIAMRAPRLNRLENRAGGMFVADRNHIHHRLLAQGSDHGRAVLMRYGARLLFALAAFISVFLQAREAALFVIALMLAGMVGVNRLGYDEFALIRRGTVLRVYEVPVVRRSMFIVFVDIAMAVLAAYLAIGLKMDVWQFPANRSMLFDLAGTAAPLTVLAFWKSGLYRGSWRLAGIDDLMRACAAALGVTILALVAHTIWSPPNLPITVFLIYGLISMIFVTGSRASYVVLLNSQRRASNQGTPVLLYGAGSGGVAGVRELFENPQAEMRPIGFIDDDLRKTGRLVSGLPVLGAEAALEDIIKEHGVKALLVTSAKIAASRIQHAKEICDRSRVNLLRLDIRVERMGDERGKPVSWLFRRRPQPWLQRLLAWRPWCAATPAPAAAEGSRSTSWACSAFSADCGSRIVHRSKARGLYERIRDATSIRLFRCATVAGAWSCLRVRVAGSALPDPIAPSTRRRSTDAADAPGKPARATCRSRSGEERRLIRDTWSVGRGPEARSLAMSVLLGVAAIAFATLPSRLTYGDTGHCAASLVSGLVGLTMPGRESRLCQGPLTIAFDVGPGDGASARALEPASPPSAAVRCRSSAADPVAP